MLESEHGFLKKKNVECEGEILIVNNNDFLLVIFKLTVTNCFQLEGTNV